MNLFDISAILLTACALGSFINYKWIKLPSSISLLLLAMGLGLLGILLTKIGLVSDNYVREFLSSINFQETVFHGMLSFILFAGGLQISIKDLKQSHFPVITTATVSTLISTIIIGIVFFELANFLGFTQVTLLYAFLFGAILSPTDPIAVLSIMKKMRLSKHIETIIVGEALFNDGIAIVIFLSILEMIKARGVADFSYVSYLLLMEIGGGVLFGLAIGWIANQFLLRVDAYQIELFITLAVATGGYALAERLHFSAPLAMVIAGIIIGNYGRYHAMSDQTRRYIDSFWEMINEVLNAVLFFLIGLEMMVINATYTLTILGLACILIALVARFISIAIPLTLLKHFYQPQPKTLIILTWGGLRAALSIAMVLSLEFTAIREVFLPCVYFVVVFSIAIQGLTLRRALQAIK